MSAHPRAHQHGHRLPRLLLLLLQESSSGSSGPSLFLKIAAGPVFKLQSEVHGRLIERFGNNEELPTTNTGSGKRSRLLQSPSNSSETSGIPATLSRVLIPLQAVVLTFGIGLLPSATVFLDSTPASSSSEPSSSCSASAYPLCRTHLVACRTLRPLAPKPARRLTSRFRSTFVTQARPSRARPMNWNYVISLSDGSHQQPAQSAALPQAQ